MQSPSFSSAKVACDTSANQNAEAIIGSSEVMRDLKREMTRIARAASTVLITGETGTGKELAAEFIHQCSPRRSNPFVCINCAAIPESLLESELFGHTKGAFTGADEYREGLLVSAHGGTILLDEIGDMSPSAQAKILRVIETKEVCRVGSSRGVKLDIRFIAATNQDLEGLADRGSFRKDLFFRLNVARIHLPALRERREDVPLLLSHYCGVFSNVAGTPVRGFSVDALRCLQGYGWPGNVRELKNVVEGLFLKDLPDKIGVEQLPQHLRGLIASSNTLSQPERDGLLAALFSAKWNKSEAARRLHWSRMTLYRKMAKYHVKEDASAPRAKRTSTL